MDLLTLKRRLLSILAEEIKAYLPQFEPRTTDHQMVTYACRDLEACMRNKWTLNSHRATYERIDEALNHEPREFRVFMNFWVGRWLEKWKERVKVLATRPELPPNVKKRIDRAKSLYRRMGSRKELKRMVTQKLIFQGEICMTEVIAENLIVEEIIKRSGSLSEDSKPVMFDTLDIYNSVSRRISRLPKEKGPLIYLNVKLYTV